MLLNINLFIYWLYKHFGDLHIFHETACSFKTNYLNCPKQFIMWARNITIDLFFLLPFSLNKLPLAYTQVTFNNIKVALLTGDLLIMQ